MAGWRRSCERAPYVCVYVPLSLARRCKPHYRKFVTVQKTQPRIEDGWRRWGRREVQKFEIVSKKSLIDLAVWEGDGFHGLAAEGKHGVSSVERAHIEEGGDGLCVVKTPVALNTSELNVLPRLVEELFAISH